MLSVKPEEDMKPLSKINGDNEKFRTMFSGSAKYNKDFKHINPQNSKAVGWEKNGVVPKPGNALECCKPSATAITMVERERVAKRIAEEAFEEVFALKKSIRELEDIFQL